MCQICQTAPLHQFCIYYGSILLVSGWLFKARADRPVFGSGLGGTCNEEL